MKSLLYYMHSGDTEIIYQHVIFIGSFFSESLKKFILENHSRNLF